jgi:preprotein translocase subunit SecG
MIPILLILSIILSSLILSQPATQESLATAFNGDKIHKNKVSLFMKRITFLVAIVIALILVYNQFF